MTRPMIAVHRPRAARTWGAVAVLAAATVVLAGCIPSGGLTPDQVKDELTEAIEPTWEVDVEGIFGEPVVRDGLVFVYAVDAEDGMRLEVRSVEDGELVWDHVASPGGAYSNPLLTSVDAASRTYPVPTIRPLLMERGGQSGDGGDGGGGDGDGDGGQDAQLVVVFFERDIPTDGSLRPDDLLRVADAETGELLEVTFEEFDEWEFRPYGAQSDGDVYLNALDPGRVCGSGRVCFLGTDADDSKATAEVALDIEALTLEYTPAVFPAQEDSVIPSWGAGFADVITDEENQLARFEDGALLWQADFDELFDDPSTSPPEVVDFVDVGDLTLIQGYQPIVETLDPDLPHTLDIDTAASRTLIAIDRKTGEVAWRAPGADMLCFAVRERSISADADKIPVCHVTDGGWVFDIESGEFLEQTDIVASIAELDLSDGSFGWEVEEAGENAVAQVTRIGDSTFASRADIAVTSSFDSLVEEGADANGPVQLVELTTGKAVAAPDDASFVCKMERDDVQLEFEGSVFAGGANPITTGYPAGWYHFPCGRDGAELDGDGTWTKGAVRVAGYPDRGGSNVVVLTTESGLVAFDLE